MIPVVIMSGQSNMVGHGSREEVNAVLPPAVKLFDLNPREGSFGPEVGFAREIQDLCQFDDLWLVKFAVGGSSLLAWEPEWSAERAAITDDAEKGALYPRLIEHFKRVTRGVDVDILACLWMQGESDSRHAAVAMQYQINLTRLIARMRKDMGQADMRFIQGAVNPREAVFSCVSVVREAQRQVAQNDQNVSLVSTDGLSKHPDHLHYDSDGLLELGRRYARQLHRQLDHSKSE